MLNDVVAGMLVLRTRGSLGWLTIAALLLAWGGLAAGSTWQPRLEFLPVGAALEVGPSVLLAHGRRLPLGLLTGAVLAGLWCVVVRAPWRATGDALAVAASGVMIDALPETASASGLVVGARYVAGIRIHSELEGFSQDDWLISSTSPASRARNPGDSAAERRPTFWIGATR